MSQVGLDVLLVDHEVDADGEVALRRREDLANHLLRGDPGRFCDLRNPAPFVLWKRGTRGDGQHLRVLRWNPVDLDVLGQRTAARRVGIHVECDVGSFGVRHVDPREGIAHPPPVLWTRGLVVRDLHRAAHLATDAERLLDGVEEPIGLVAHVGGVDSAALAKRLGERDHLLGRAVTARPVDEPGRESAGALLERLLDPAAHLRELGAGRSA